jgi:transposase InsO family protein
MESTAEHAVRPAFERLFERYGLPASIRSDNGTPFASHQAPLGLSRLSSWWVSLGIRLDRIDPGRPDQNGAHERIHRDIRAELQLTPSDGVEASQALFDQWRHEFNWTSDL